MLAWWGVYSEKGAQMPIALFQDKDYAETFSEHVEGHVEVCNFYETDEEADFLDNAERIW